MLKGIPKIISPELMKILMEMGHGDEIVLSDANFPAVTCAKRLIRKDGHTIPDLLKAIMLFFPLDHAVSTPVIVMALNEGEPTPDVWVNYQSIIRESGHSLTEFEYMERFSFYERAKNAFAVIATGDQAFKGNVILKKGVIRE